MANALPRWKQVAVVAALTEGCSLRSASRPDATGADKRSRGPALPGKAARRHEQARQGYGRAPGDGTAPRARGRRHGWDRAESCEGRRGAGGRRASGEMAASGGVPALRPKLDRARHRRRMAWRRMLVMSDGGLKLLDEPVHVLGTVESVRSASNRQVDGVPPAERPDALALLVEQREDLPILCDGPLVRVR